MFENDNFARSTLVTYGHKWVRGGNAAKDRARHPANTALSITVSVHCLLLLILSNIIRLPS